MIQAESRGEPIDKVGAWQILYNFVLMSQVQIGTVWEIRGKEQELFWGDNRNPAEQKSWILRGLESDSWDDPKIKFVADKIFHNFVIAGFSIFGV
jgi:hypothetical protein